MKPVYYFSFILLLFLSCKKSTPSDVNNNNNNSNNSIDSSNSNTNNNNNTPVPQLFEYSISPSVTNAAITTYNNAHFILLDTRTVLKNKLFVFLPGTTGYPGAYKSIVQKAASLGYHSIGLMYPNGPDLYTAAANNPDNTAFGKCRQEIFDGSDQTSGVTVSPDNCIKNRLYNLLVYLQQQHPDQNWQQYFSNGNIDWSKIVIAGHSQGGGHAFYIAKKVMVSKAISFSSIDWNSALGRSADWINEPGATPISSYYSFNGVNDEIFAYANVQTQLASLGLTGPAINIDQSASPYLGSHTLTTAATAALSIIYPGHNVTCLDLHVPRTSSGEVIPTFMSAWEYLLNN